MCGFDSNSIIAFAAVVNVIVTFFLWLSTRRTANIASATLKFATAPKLVIEVHKLIEDPVEGTAILVHVKNGGTGHAVITKFSTSTIIGGDAIPPRIEKQNGITILGNSHAEI